MRSRLPSKQKWDMKFQKTMPMICCIATGGGKSCRILITRTEMKMLARPLKKLLEFAGFRQKRIESHIRRITGSLFPGWRNLRTHVQSGSLLGATKNPSSITFTTDSSIQLCLCRPLPGYRKPVFADHAIFNYGLHADFFGWICQATSRKTNLDHHGSGCLA